MARVLETPVQQRFSDIDPFMHVNNVAQQAYFDVGKVDFYRKVLGAEVLLGDLRIVTVSTSTLFQRLVVGGQTLSESRSVMVVFSFARQSGEPVPAAWRESLLSE